jgi:large subunit ribosomal protein L25
MQEEIVIQAEKRQVTGKQVRALRRQGKLPAVLYGRHMDAPVAVMLDAHSAGKILPRLGPTRLVTVKVGAESYPALVREKQREPVLGYYLHVDFYVVSLTEKIRTTVRIELAGNSPAVKDYGAILVTGLEEVEIECLPRDLPESLVVDVSSLKMIGDSLTLADVPIPPHVEVLDDFDELVVQVTPPMAEEAEEAAPAAAEPEVIEKGKKEEEE